MIKAIIFDVDGVLVDSRESNIAFYQKLLAKAGYPDISRKSVLECFHLPLWQSIEKLTRSSDQKEVKRIFDMVEDRSLRDASLFVFPDKIEEILNNLHKDYKLAIVTSRIKIGVDDVFSAREIKHLFDVVVSFEDYENPKPHPEPLLVALKKLDMSANEAVYVGDSHVDVEAAKEASMRCIFLSSKPNVDADVNIESFSELISAVKQL